MRVLIIIVASIGMHLTPSSSSSFFHSTPSMMMFPHVTYYSWAIVSIFSRYAESSSHTVEKPKVARLRNPGKVQVYFLLKDHFPLLVFPIFH